MDRTPENINSITRLVRYSTCTFTDIEAVVCVHRQSGTAGSHDAPQLIEIEH